MAVSAAGTKLPYPDSQTVADMSHAFPAPSRGEMRPNAVKCRRMRRNVLGNAIQFMRIATVGSILHQVQTTTHPSSCARHFRLPFKQVSSI
jgi:hypothetical protein